MASLTFTIAAGDIDLLAKSYNYQATVPDPANPGQTIANPETKGQFCKRIYTDQITERIVNQKKQDAIVAANITPPTIT